MYRHVHGQAHHSVGHIYRYVHAHCHPIDMYTRRMTPKDMCTHRVTLQICTRILSPSDVHAVTLRHVHAQGHPYDMYTHIIYSPLTRAHKVTQTCIQTGSPSGIETGSFPDIYRHVHAQGHLRHVYKQGHTSDKNTRKVTL